MKKQNVFYELKVCDVNNDEELSGIPPAGMIWYFPEWGTGLVRFLCPCGGDHAISLPTSSIIEKGKWSLKIEKDEDSQKQSVTISPSIRDMMTCHSHYFIEKNTVRFV